MSETKNPSDGASGAASKGKTLTLKRSGGSFDKGGARGGFGGGRSKTAVVVEKKRRRVVKPGAAGAAEAAPKTQPEPVAEAPAPEREAKPKPNPAPAKDNGKGRTGVVLRTLTQEEQGARAAALEQARVREEEERKLAVERARIEAEEAERRAKEEAEAEKRRAEEEARLKAENAANEAAEAQAQTQLEEKTAVAPKPAPRKAAQDEAKPAAAEAPQQRTSPPRTRGREVSLEEASREAERLKRAKVDTKSPKRSDDRRRASKLTVTAAFGEDGAEERSRSLASIRRRREREKRQLAEQGNREKISREVQLPETITIQELANRMAERAVDVIKLLMKQGQMLKINDVIDADTAELIASELGHSVKRVSEADVEEGLFGEPDTDEEGQPRPPVVTIMGHVDHGKTSLLDALRQANVVSGEAGGITQHIGAYQVEHEGAKTTFIDTPGHEAFTSMRARGAKVTDIVILVVAADDSVMPQTIEAINHAKAAEVPMIVAINKVDKPDADPMKVRTELLQHEIVVEGMSGDVQDIEVSALKKTGLDDLLEAIALQSEILELKANADRPAEGVVIEAKLDKGRGPVGTVLVQRGTLRRGDIIVAGGQWAKVRALINDHGDMVEEAGPSTPVEVLGFDGAPAAGDRFAVVETEARAREITEYRQRQAREKASVMGTGARGSLEQMMSQLRESGRAEFPLVIKADVQGSAEAISQALEKLNTDEVAARILMSGVGGITESDISLAATSNAAIIGFNVRANKGARELADQEGIEIRYYNIIYDLVDDIKQAMSGLLAPEQRETFLGNAEILQVFRVSKVGNVAGCRVTEGVVERGANVRLIRDNVVVHEGELSQLKRFKDDASQVVAGQECGMAFANYQDMREGDVIECYRVEEVARSL